MSAGSTRIANGVSGVGAEVAEGIAEGTGLGVGSAGRPSEHELRLAANNMRMTGLFRRTGSLLLLESAGL
jgi:hypothetical protein